MSLPANQINTIFELQTTIHNRLVLLYAVGFHEVHKVCPDITVIGIATGINEAMVRECLSDLVQLGFIESLGGDDYVLIPSSYQPRKTLASALKSVLSRQTSEVRPIDALKAYQASYLSYRGKKPNRAFANKAYPVFRNLSKKFSAKFVLRQIKPFFTDPSPTWVKEPLLDDFKYFVERKYRQRQIEDEDFS